MKRAMGRTRASQSHSDSEVGSKTTKHRKQSKSRLQTKNALKPSRKRANESLDPKNTKKAKLVDPEPSKVGKEKRTRATASRQLRYQDTEDAQESGQNATLDNCTCFVSRRDLRAQTSAKAESLPSDLSILQNYFQCPSCQIPLTRRDASDMLDSKTLWKVDFHFANTAGESEGTRLEKGKRKSKRHLGNKRKLIDNACRLASTIQGLQNAGTEISSSSEIKEASQEEEAKKITGLPKGTGYDDSDDDFLWSEKDIKGKENALKAKQKKAMKAEHDSDQNILEAIMNIKTCIEDISGCEENGVPQSSSMLLCAIVSGSSLPYMLRGLLKNDSLLDISRRGDLYKGVFALIHSLTQIVDFAPILLKRVEEPRSSEEAGVGASSVFDQLYTLSKQSSIFKQSAQELLDVRSRSQSLENKKAVDLALAIEECFKGLQEIARDFGPKIQEDTAKDKNSDSLEKRYCEEMLEFSLRQTSISGFHFQKELTENHGSASSQKKSLLRLTQEISGLATSLPISFASSVFLVTDEARMDILRALIVGPEDTPYENGLYLFDILLPEGYPECPPKVQFLTTGQGKCRFNPNLYETGLVCLSLLGTWADKSTLTKIIRRSFLGSPAFHTPAGSEQSVHLSLSQLKQTIMDFVLQVLVSIQSLIFVGEPYFNEPGFQGSAGTNFGNEESKKYNDRIRSYNLEHAILPALQHRDPVFGHLLRKHFRLKKEAILTQLEIWCKEDDALQDSAEKIRNCLTNY